MQSYDIAGYLVPLTDAFQGEYVPACSQRLGWLTGFTGSNGLAVILKDTAAFFTDGRYTIQAKQQVDGKSYQHFNSADTTPWEWVKRQLPAGGALGYDPWLHTKNYLQYYEKQGVTLKPCEPNIIDGLWQDRPAWPTAPAVFHPLEFSGEENLAKRQRLAGYLKEKSLDAIMLTAPDSICWLLNIRGADVPHTPFVLCYALAYADASIDLFIPTNKVTDEIRGHLGKSVRIIELSTLKDSISVLNNKVIQVDVAQAPAWFSDRLATHNTVREGTDPCQLWKACKNAMEIAGMRAAHIRDGAALTQFLHWLEHHKGTVTELSAAEKLADFRKGNKYFQDLSFDTISGFASNGAIVHYRVTETTNKTLKRNGLYLVDSGAQYLDGTTDVTRTVAIGNPTDEERDRFTRVLKGHIALARVVFPQGTTGSQLDTLARYHLWQIGLDYDHGTGHGVGSYLSVHEGPQRISKMPNNVALQPGMVISNEPGYYKEGEYGIRIESLVLVVEKPEFSTLEKRFFGFETLTQAPIDKKLINMALLTAEEVQWLDNYHRNLCKVLTPHVGEEVLQWLERF